MLSLPSYERLLLEAAPEEGILRVVLNRPEKRNALDLKLLEEYCDLLERTMNSDFRVLITSGAGPSFCAGMDLHDLGRWAKRWDTGEFAWSDFGPLTRLLGLLRRHTCVTISQVHGYCAGGGLAMVVAHDLAVAAHTARFILPETARGSFGALAAAAIHYAVPPKKAFDMQLTGRELLGDEADALGLVSRSTTEEELADEVSAMAAEVASRDRIPLGHAKMAALLNEGRGFDEVMRNDLLVRTHQDAARNSFSDVDGFLAERSRRSRP